MFLVVHFRFPGLHVSLISLAAQPAGCTEEVLSVLNKLAFAATKKPHCFGLRHFSCKLSFTISVETLHRL